MFEADNPAEQDNLDGLFAAIVAWNPGPDLAECVRSLARFLPLERILVADNACSDGSVNALPAGIPVLRFSGNTGFCAAMNRLVEEARRRGGRHVLALNPDARIERTGAGVLLSAMQARGAAVTYPKILLRDRPGILDGAYGKITWRHIAVDIQGHGAPDHPRWNVEREVDCGLGACFVADVRAYLDAGGMDEALFAYHDEADLCLRIRRRGGQAWYIPSAVAFHGSGARRSFRSELRMYLVARNSALLVARHGGWKQKVKFACFLAAGVAYYACRALAGSRDARAALRGWSDGLHGRWHRPAILPPEPDAAGVASASLEPHARVDR